MSNEKPSSASIEHLKTVTEQYQVMRQPGPLARFSYDFSSIGIWCLPHNHPGGLWDGLDFYKNADPPYNPSQAQGLGSVYPVLDSDQHTITAFVIQTQALPLFNQSLVAFDAIKNRPEDLRWTVEQLAWLWEQAFPGTPLPPVKVTDWQSDPSDMEDLADWVFSSAARKPGEPLSPPPTPKHPRPF